jgi:rhodanese-related sulfurtransferase
MGIRPHVFAMVAAVVLLLVLATGAAACGGTNGAADHETYRTATVQALDEALRAGAGAQLVDVREPAEWQSTGVIAEAELIPLGDLEKRAPGELAKDKPVYVICRSGNRSRAGAQTLVGLGYKEVYSVDGGITAWIDAGLPVVPYAP